MQIVTDGDVTQFRVTRRDGTVIIILIDTEDLERTKDMTWGLTNGYATTQKWSDGRGSKRTLTLLHRFILNLKEGDPCQVDHINRDRLDCRKANLRIATRSQNMVNIPKKNTKGGGYRGVVYNHGQWRAHISNKGVIHLGAYGTQEEAARAYDLAAMEYQGDFAVLNFPEDKEKYLAGLIVHPERRTKSSPRPRKAILIEELP